jgi:isoleucyl-tRNA synthetase
VDVQREEFKRLGVFARWDEPYLTMSFDYEANIVRELAPSPSAGRWCAARSPSTGASRTAPRWPRPRSSTRTTSRRPSTSPSRSSATCPARPSRARGPSWSSGPPRRGRCRPTSPSAPTRTSPTSSTTWAAGACVVAKELLASFLSECAPSELAIKDVSLANTSADSRPAPEAQVAALASPGKILGYLQGKDLEGVKYRHVLNGKTCPVVLGDHVTAESGTGLVHTAPGHGAEDYLVGRKYGLDTLSR